MTNYSDDDMEDSEFAALNLSMNMEDTINYSEEEQEIMAALETGSLRDLLELKLSTTLSNAAYEQGKKTKVRIEEQKKTVAYLKNLIEKCANKEVIENVDKLISEIITPPVTGQFFSLLDDPEEALKKQKMDWVCSDLGMVAGDSIMLSADPFTGKTYLANYFALCVITGEKMFNKFEMQKSGKVAVLNWDSNPRQCQISLRRLQAGMGVKIKDAEALYYESPLWKLDQPLAYQYLKKICTGRILCVIDSFRSCFSGDENSSEDTAPVIELANRVSRETNCVILFISHTGKSGTEKGLQANRGSSAVPAATGSLWTLERGVNSNTCKLNCHKGREYDFGKIVYQYSEEGEFLAELKKKSKVIMSLVEGECSGPNEKEEPKKDIPTQVKEYLFLNQEKKNGMTEMKSKITGKNTKIDASVKEMVEKGILIVSHEGKYDYVSLSEETKKEIQNNKK